MTIVNKAASIDVRLNPYPQQEGAMGAKSKSRRVRGAARKPAAKPPGKRRCGTAPGPDAWEQTAQAPDGRDDEIDCQRIVQGDDGRSPPLYYDDYN